MNSRTRRKRQTVTKHAAAFLWRQCAMVMLLVVVWDICFDLIAPLHADPDASFSGVGITGTSEADPESHPGCGIPDHSCSLSHHHHFPAVVSTAQFTISAVASNGPEGTAQVKAIHIPQANRQIRAPPETL